MNLYIVRHAEAIDRGSGVPDPERYLTPKGRAYFRKTAKNMIRSGASPDVIVTSPLVRSVQTAEILAERLGFKRECIVSGELSPGFSLPGLRRILADLPPMQEVALVGHDPDLSDLLISLLSLGDGFRLKKGAAVALRVDPSRFTSSAQFLWMALGKRRIDSRDDLME
jgi:phosphohistidine phosphatase